jgi:hypothetical protein
MKSTFLYIPKTEPCTVQLTVRLFPVGISHREQSQLAAIQSAALRNGDYLTLRDHEADLFLSRLAEQIYGEDSLSLTRFLSRNVVRTTLEEMHNRLFPRKSRKLSIHVEIADL